MSGETVRTLPADVYDALELGALVDEGVGAGSYGLYSGIEECTIGNCIFGIAREVASGGPYATGTAFTGIWSALHDAGISPQINDNAVARINARNGAECDARVTFAEWCAELGVVRGTPALRRLAGARG